MKLLYAEMSVFAYNTMNNLAYLRKRNSDVERKVVYGCNGWGYIKEDAA